MMFLKSSVIAFVCFWVAKVFSFYLAHHRSTLLVRIVVCTFIFLLNIMALIEFGRVFNLVRETKFSFWNGCLRLLILTFIVSLPFAPDMIILLHNTGYKYWILAFVALCISVSSFCFILRFPAIYIVSKIHSLGKVWRLVAIGVAVLVLHLGEGLSLFLIPFVYPTGFALPISLEAKDQMGVPQKKLSNNSNLIVLINPTITDMQRSRLEARGWDGLNQIVEKIAKIEFEHIGYKDVTLIFPETTLFANSHQVRQLLGGVAKLWPNSSVTLIIGVREENKNIVYGAHRSIFGDIVVWKLKSKFDLMPLVETEIAGIYLGDVGTQTVAEFENGSNWRGLEHPLAESRLLICYEALQFKNIFLSRGAAFVLTNHSSFSSWMVTSQAYDASLRTLFGLSGRQLILAGNFGLAGMFENGQKELLDGDFIVKTIDIGEP